LGETPEHFQRGGEPVGKKRGKGVWGCDVISPWLFHLVKRAT